MPYNQEAAMNALRGAQNRTKGKVFEEYIEAACRHYADIRAAFIEKTPEPFRITRSIGQGKFQGHFEAQAQPDFKGTLFGGRSICFDAKTTDTGKIPVSALTAGQVADLEKHTKLGALTGVMLCFSFRTFAFIPFYDFMDAKKLNGHKHWTEEEVEPYAVELENGHIAFLKSHIAQWNMNMYRAMYDYRDRTHPSASLKHYASEIGLLKDGMTAEMILKEIYEKEKKQ